VAGLSPGSTLADGTKAEFFSDVEFSKYGTVVHFGQIDVPGPYPGPLVSGLGKPCQSA